MALEFRSQVGCEVQLLDSAKFAPNHLIHMIYLARPPTSIGLSPANEDALPVQVICCPP